MNIVLTIKQTTGREISTVLLTAPYRVFFSQVIVFTRDINSASARALAGLGAVLHQIVAQPDSDSEDKDVLRDALRGVDVFIDALGGDADKGLMDRLFDAALASGVAVYFPSEFGVCVSLPLYAWIVLTQSSLIVIRPQRPSSKQFPGIRARGVGAQTRACGARKSARRGEQRRHEDHRGVCWVVHGGSNSST